MVILILTVVGWSGMFLFSYLWVNKSLILMLAEAHPGIMELGKYVEFGNTNREVLVLVWIGLVMILTAFQIYWLYQKGPKIRLFWVGVIVGLAALSYPFISKDIFNYLFAGRMVVAYGENPYLVMPLEHLGSDLWLGFTDNIDKTYFHVGDIGLKYNYGPVFLVFSLIPFLAAGGNRFILLFLGYKMMTAVLFLASGWLLLKINKGDKKVWAYWFLNPFLLFELLLNSHNDLLMIFLFFLAVFYWQKKRIVGIGFYLLSVLSKFFSGFLFWLWLVKERRREIAFKLVGFGILFYQAINRLHPWYYSWAYMVFPFAGLKRRTWVLMFVLESLVMVGNYGGFIWWNRWTPLPYFPDQYLIRWVIPMIMLVSETSFKVK